MSDNPTPPEEDLKVSVSAKALRSVLTALNGPPHHIRELQALRGSGLSKLTGDVSPIDTLVEQFNAEIDRLTAPAAPPTPAEPEIPDAPRVMPPMPTKQSELGHRVVPFFFDSLEHTRPDDFEGVYRNLGIAFGETDLRPRLGSGPDLLGESDQKPLEGYFDDELEVTSVIARIQTGSGFKLITLDIPGGKSVVKYEPDSVQPFNVTMHYAGQLFTLQAFISWEPKTGILRAAAAGFNYDISMQRLGARLKIEDAIIEVTPHCLHVRGRFHQQFA